MSTLIIYAHPNPKSFNHAIKETVATRLNKEGKEVIVRDLYGMNFHPVLNASDFVAFAGGKAPSDIAKEQSYIKKADHLVVIHPIWWFGMPAMLKGYIDRVFAKGFAYDFGASGVVGLLKGKKVTIINTTGGDEQTYSSAGFNNALKITQEIGVFGLCGMEVVTHKFFYGVPMATPDARAKMLEELSKLIF